MINISEDVTVVYRRRHAVDAIDQYSRHLTTALAQAGVVARYIDSGIAGLADGPLQARILLQYNPFAYGHSGIAPRLLVQARRLRRTARWKPALMVHEAWVGMTDWRTTATGLWQRGQLRDLLHQCGPVFTSTEALAKRLGGGTIHLPVGANIMPEPLSPARTTDRREHGERFTVALFGRDHPDRALDYAEAAIVALAAAHGPNSIVVLNLGAGARPVAVPPGVELRTPNTLESETLSEHLSSADLVLLPFVDGLSTRRTTMMAALAHGRAVLGLRSPQTDAILVRTPSAIALSELGDRSGFARSAVALSLDGDRLDELGHAGRRLYESEFDWPVIARRIVDALGMPAPKSSLLV
jgi:glycosyltransferase involved in cell wall biosynthesis